MSILIKNGQLVTAAETYVADIFMEGEQIVAIGKNLNYRADTIIDATDKLVFPGGIDPHVHLDMPFMGTHSSDDYETGTRAALHGGTTMVIDFILQTQGDSLHNALKTWQQKSAGKAVGDYSYHMAVTDFNDDVAKEVVQMIEEEGISSFKTFMAYKGALMIDDGQMVQLMKVVKKHGGLVTVHATNGDMIDSLIAKNRAQGNLSPIYHYLSQPEVTESEASARFADMLEYTGCTGYIVHMTCEGALNAVRKATQRNQKVFVETCTQYLLLDASLYENDFEGAKWVMSPPLREKKDQAALWSGINQGLIQVIGTDHCPFLWEQKKMGKDDFSKIPNGHPAIEHRMELLFSEGVHKGKISLTKYVEITSTNAAKIFGMYPRKGTIAIGSDADIVIFDPKKEHTISVETHHMNCDYSGYEGQQVIGKTEIVILRGQIAIENETCKLQPGHGQFIRRGKTSKTVI
ncbi:MAG: dihydropyrimidinase [Flavobacteriaceae bacterium]|nr:dihydropyrimidinase [Flavobacteriaceae bacterium]